MHTEEKVTNKQKLNPSLPKQINISRGPEQDFLIAQEDNEIEELQKSIQEDWGIADDENEDRATRERLKERIIENQERIDALENERKKWKKALHYVGG